MSDVAGKSVLDLLWERLDQFMDELMAPAHKDEFELAYMKGRAYGMAEAIALVNNPYHADIDAVRSDAMERWELRQEASTQNELTTLSARIQRRAERRARRLRNG